MNKAIPLIGLIALAVVLSGCTSEPAQPATSYKYVCSDGTIADVPSSCETAYKYVCSDGQIVDSAASCPTDTNPQPSGLTVETIQAEMETANYCTVKDDCVETNTKCPIGCYNLVNVAELDRINELVREFKQTCFQTCATLEDFECVDGMCNPILPGVG